MLTYIPCAICPELLIRTLSTSDQLNSIESCLEQYEIWRDNYHYTLIDCWIQVFKDGKHIADLAIDWNPEP